MRIETFVQRKLALAGDCNERTDFWVFRVIFWLRGCSVLVYVSRQLDGFTDGLGLGRVGGRFFLRFG